MSESQLGCRKDASTNGAYKFDLGYTWFVLIGGTLALLLILGAFVAATSRNQTVGLGLAVAGALCVVALIVAIASVVKSSSRTVQVNDDGIWVQDKRGNGIGGLHWGELAKVTASNKMAQLLLWDGAGRRRVVIDRNVENFARIRGRILKEYARVFTFGLLPFEFRRSNFWTLDGIACVVAAVVMGLVSFRVYLRGQPGSGILLLLLFAIPLSLYFLRINPQFFGPSQLFEDRIVLSGLFRKRVMYKEDVTGVEIVDFSAGKSGTSSMIVVTARNGMQLKILQRYGNLPDIYLTLQAWLAR
jgi:hypothetical protein